MNAVDLFAGAGGWSHGWREATDCEPMVAVNHCPHAVHLHRLNHPGTEHFLEDVWSVDPAAAVAGRRVDWLHGSPDCTHFSRAKGGKPREQKIRGLAWVLVDWARAARPQFLSLENVAEFETWGPLDDDGQPIKARAGETFREFVAALRGLGYQVDWRVLCAADFGAPTIRRRLFLVARRDGQPIRWPEPTHADPKILYGRSSEDVRERSRGPGAAQGGTAPSGRVGGAGLRDRVQDADEANRLAQPSRLPADLHHHPRQGHLFACASAGLDRRERSAGARSADQPQGWLQDEQLAGQPRTGDSGREQPAREADRALEAREGSGQRLREADGRAGASGSLDEGVRGFGGEDRVDLRDQRGLREEGRQGGRPGLLPWVAASTCIDWSIPCPSIFGRRRPLAPATCRRIAAGIVRFVLQGKPFLVTMTTGSRPRGIDEPTTTITGQGMHQALVAPTVIETAHGDFSERNGKRSHRADAPLGVVTGSNNHALVAAFLQQNFTGMVGKPLRVPVPTITARDHHSLVAATMVQTGYGERRGQAPRALDLEQPLGTIVAGGAKHALVAAFLTTYYGQGGTANALDKPMPAIVTRARHGLVTVEIDGVDYAIADIGLRMLEPRELARAQGFPDSYVLEGTKAEQIARIGNSVVPQVAAAIVRANLGREACVA